MSMFCDIALAERVERAESDLMAQGATARGGVVFPVAGGFATFAEAESPLNKVSGLGFGGVPTSAELDEIERLFAERGTPVQVELAHVVDSAIGELLTGRRYRLTSFENVLGTAVTAREPVRPQGVEVRRITGAELDAWIDVVTDGVAEPDTQGLASHEEFPREVVANALHDMAAAGAGHYLGLVDGKVAGGASMRVTDSGVAQFGGAATAPAFRRRGLQSMFLSVRMADALAAGCDIAAVTTQPASKSHQNVQRQGFDLLYTRAVLVKG
jgi:GNAT superfamily N-acetyltransferase